MSQYGYITGQFDIDLEKDIVLDEYARKESDGSIINYIGIETTRDLTNENVVTFSSGKEFNEWLYEYGQIDEI